ncbi:MAG: hypothetical protein LBE62_13180 [Azonexus sp.]|jgi:hypothetical protein|nr:hypothetical protein [Azonexus sp.]
MDQTIFDVINKNEEEIEGKLNANVIYFLGEIRYETMQLFRNFIEKLCGNSTHKRDVLAICLTTPGGSAEVVEKLVEIIRHHFNTVYFIVPHMAMSAGTIFCMSGDRIYMDYASSLGPIDPQVPDKDGKYLVPALGYLDKVFELIEKSRNNTITAAEFALLEKQDLAMLRSFEQAKELSIELLKKWLVEYKFKDWSQHRTNNPGAAVTEEEKKARAEDIAKNLSDNNRWHSHGRFISMRTLADLRLQIDDLGVNAELHKYVRLYSDTLADYLTRQRIPFFLYNRHVN